MPHAVQTDLGDGALSGNAFGSRFVIDELGETVDCASLFHRAQSVRQDERSSRFKSLAADGYRGVETVGVATIDQLERQRHRIVFRGELTPWVGGA